MRIAIPVVLALLGAAVPAAAEDRGHVRALGGVTFGDASTAAFYGGGAAFKVTDNLSITAELGRMENVAGDDEVVDAAEDALALVGVDVDLDIDAPAFYGLAGARFEILPEGRVRPYVDGGIGFASVNTDVDLSVEGFDLPRGFAELLDDSVGAGDRTELLLAVGGGVALDVTDQFGVDLGYRFHRIATDEGLNVHGAYAGLRFGF